MNVPDFLIKPAMESAKDKVREGFSEHQKKKDLFEAIRSELNKLNIAAINNPNEAHHVDVLKQKAKETIFKLRFLSQGEADVFYAEISKARSAEDIYKKFSDFIDIVAKKTLRKEELAEVENVAKSFGVELGTLQSQVQAQKPEAPKKTPIQEVREKIIQSVEEKKNNNGIFKILGFLGMDVDVKSYVNKILDKLEGKSVEKKETKGLFGLLDMLGDGFSGFWDKIVLTFLSPILKGLLPEDLMKKFEELSKETKGIASSEKFNEVKDSVKGYIMGYMKKMPNFDEKKFHAAYEEFLVKMPKSGQAMMLEKFEKYKEKFEKGEYNDISMKDIFESIGWGGGSVLTFVSVFMKHNVIDIKDIGWDLTKDMASGAYETTKDTVIYSSKLILHSFLSLGSFNYQDIVGFIKGDMYKDMDAATQEIFRSSIVSYLLVNEFNGLPRMISRVLEGAGNVVVDLISNFAESKIYSDSELITKTGMSMDTFFKRDFTSSMTALTQIEAFVATGNIDAKLGNTIIEDINKALISMKQRVFVANEYISFRKSAAAGSTLEDFISHISKNTKGYFDTKTLEDIGSVLRNTKGGGSDIGNIISNYVKSGSIEIGEMFKSSGFKELLSKSISSKISINPASVMDSISSKFTVILDDVSRLVSPKVFDKFRNLMISGKLAVEVREIDGVKRNMIFIKDANTGEQLGKQLLELFKESPSLIRAIFGTLPLIFFGHEFDNRFKDKLAKGGDMGQAFTDAGIDSFKMFISVYGPITIAVEEADKGNYIAAGVAGTIGAVEALYLGKLALSNWKNIMNIPAAAGFIAKHMTIAGSLADLGGFVLDKSGKLSRILGGIGNMIEKKFSRLAGKGNRVAQIAFGLAVLGFGTKYLYDYIENNKFLQEAGMKSKDPEGFNKWIHENWAQLNKEEKQVVVNVYLTFLLSREINENMEYHDLANLKFDGNNVAEIDISDKLNRATQDQKLVIKQALEGFIQLQSNPITIVMDKTSKSSAQA